MFSCISVRNLVKDFSKIRAIDNISFEAPCGKVFGLLGPKGAGKTTTIKILTTLMRPSSGTVHLFGKDIQKHSLDIRRRIGIVLQKPSFEPRLTVHKALDLYGFIWGVNPARRRSRIEELLEIFDLKPIRNIKK